VDTRNEQGVALIDAIEAVLRPMLPLFRNFGVTNSDLSQLIARLFVYDTAELLEQEGRPTTAARLALMTGLTRGEVEKHLAGRTASTARQSKNASELMTPPAALTLWNTDPRFSTPYGVALDLSLEPGGRYRSFQELVEATSPGADPEVMLDLLVAAGCAEVNREGGFVRCSNRAYIPSGVSANRIARIGTVMGGLAANMTRNLLLEESEISDFERTVHTDFPVSETGRNAIREWLSSDGLRFLETLDAWMNSNQPSLDAASGEQVGVDIFMYNVPSGRSERVRIQSAANS
jgi:hypothetical protein